MSTSFIEETSHTRIDLHNRLLDTQNELQGKIQQLIKNYGRDSADRRHRDGFYFGELNQLNDLWRQFCDLDEEVQQAALPTGSEYSSRLVACRLEADSRRPPDELRPTSRSQQEIKSKETPQLTRWSDSFREEATNFNHH